MKGEPSKHDVCRVFTEPSVYESDLHLDEFFVSILNISILINNDDVDSQNQ